MDDALDYVYAFTWADCPLQSLGPAVDPRFRIELVHDGRVAALASRVGLDQFDLAKLEAPTVDPDWVSRVAVCHHQVVAGAARSRPVLPLRMGTLFRSRASLLVRLGQCRATIEEFLRGLGDRREWAAKVYLEAPQGQQALCTSPPEGSGAAGMGAQYLAGRRQQQQARRIVREDSQRHIAALEAALAGRADRHCRVPVLSAKVTGRREKMLWNSAFLVSRSGSHAWLETADGWRRTLAPRGLLLEVSGPWPPYHFCPEV